MDEDDLMQSEWRWQTVDDYIAAVQAVLDYEIARVCRLDGLLLGKNYLEGEARRKSQFDAKMRNRRSGFQNKSSLRHDAEVGNCYLFEEG